MEKEGPLYGVLVRHGGKGRLKAEKRSMTKYCSDNPDYRRQNGNGGGDSGCVGEGLNQLRNLEDSTDRGTRGKKTRRSVWALSVGNFWSTRRTWSPQPQKFSWRAGQKGGQKQNTPNASISDLKSRKIQVEGGWGRGLVCDHRT